MKINNVEGSSPAMIPEVQGKGRTKAAPETAAKGTVAAGSGSSQVEISDRARMMKAAFDSAKAAPDYRDAKVNLLKSQIKDGSYRVDSGAVAEALLNDHLDTDFGKNNL